jgi:hypothetical protein
MRPKLTYANVMATIAVFIALSGASYAAFKLPKNSVGTKQLKKNAVTSPKVKDHSLIASDFKEGQLPEGKQGPKGEAGTPATALWAVLNPDGTLAAGSHVLVSGGKEPYSVTFDRDVSKCALVASPNGPYAQVVVSSVVSGGGGEVSIDVISRETGSYATDQVSVAAFCSS